MGLKDKHHWEDHYSLELNNFKEDGDEGEIWFGLRFNNKIADWVLKWIQQSYKAVEAQTKPVGIIDIGCGNSQLLITINKNIKMNIKDTNQNSFFLFGIDFASSAVELSREILRTASVDDEIQVEQCDFLDLTQVKSLRQNNKRFNFVLDKGTFDAICLLAEENNPNGVTGTIENYKSSLVSLMEPNDIFVLSSCNHTEDELLNIFQTPLQGENEIHRLKPIDKIETPTISFGGKTGSQVTCIIFELV